MWNISRSFMTKNRLNLLHKLRTNANGEVITNRNGDIRNLMTTCAQTELLLKSIFPATVQKLKNSVVSTKTEGGSERIEQMLNHTVLGGRLFRSSLFLNAYLCLCKHEADMQKASLVGLALEMVHAGVIISDDFLDGSDIRRGKLVWYKIIENPLLTVNDTIVLYNLAIELLKQSIKSQPYYVPLIELINDVNIKTYAGQTMDTLSQSSFQKNGFQYFTIEHYECTVLNKTCYYTFYAPIVAALYMSERYDEKTLKLVLDISKDLSLWFQIKNDYVDCFCENISGKIGKGEQNDKQLKNSITNNEEPKKYQKISGENCDEIEGENIEKDDIQSGRRTWFIVMALQRANQQQIKILQQNYGKSGYECVSKVKEIYKNVGLPKLFEEYTAQIRSSVEKKISCEIYDQVMKETLRKCIEINDRAYFGENK